MARLSLILILLTLIVKSFSQTVSRNVIASAGNSVIVNGFNISSTIGQMPFQTMSDNSYYITQGFEQPGIKLHITPGEFVQAFPNPVIDYLYLIFSLNIPKDFIITIFSLNGTELQTISAPGIQNGVPYSIDFTRVPDGMILLHIYDNSVNKKLYKVIKLEKINKSNN